MELRGPWSNRLSRMLSLGMALTMGVVIALLYLRIAERRSPPSCARGYVEAQSAADTAIVDEQPAGAASSRLDAAGGATCGELRLRGEVRD